MKTNLSAADFYARDSFVFLIANNYSRFIKSTGKIVNHLVSENNSPLSSSSPQRKNIIYTTYVPLFVRDPFHSQKKGNPRLFKKKKKKKSTPFLVGTIRNLDSIKEKKEIRKNHRNLKELDEELSMSINSRLYTHRHTDR